MMIKQATATLSLCVMACVWIPFFSSCASLPEKWGRSLPHTNRKDAAKFISTIRPIRGDGEPHYLLGCYLQERNKHKLAIEEFMTTVELDLKHTNAYNAMGVSYDHLGEFTKSIEAYNAALKIDPKLDYVNNNLGFAHLLNGNSDLAIRSFKQAIALDVWKKTVPQQPGRPMQ